MPGAAETKPASGRFRAFGVGEASGAGRGVRAELDVSTLFLSGGRSQGEGDGNQLVCPSMSYLTKRSFG
jgi:hypothetical protein